MRKIYEGIYGYIQRTFKQVYWGYLWVKPRVRTFYRTQPELTRLFSFVAAMMMLMTVLMQPWDGKVYADSYDLTRAVSVLPKTNELYAQKLIADQKGGYIYNDGYTATPGEVAGQVSGPAFSANFGSAEKGIVGVTDAQNKVSFGVDPLFAVASPRKDENRVVYPIQGRKAAVVYTARAASVKEDIVLFSSASDKAEFEYSLVLDKSLEPRLESNGSIAVYGIEGVLLGTVSTSTDADAKLLDKARSEAKKTKLLFTIPKPVVVEKGKRTSTVKSWFELNGNRLKLRAEGLKEATYPLSIDPTIYIETATKLMRGNNETNIDFDLDNELIQKSQTTGARIDAWTATNNFSNAIWGQGTAAAGGYIYSVGGGEGNGATTTDTYYTAGSTSWPVPTGVTSLTIKAWGAGGGGGAGSGSTSAGGNGGGGGFAQATVSVTAGNSISIAVGTGGAKASVASGGGNGGGLTSVTNTSTSTLLIQAGGGGGGGGTVGTRAGGNGGAGGGATAVDGSTPATGGGGGFGGSTTLTGTPSDGGAANTGGVAGISGAANAGGDAGTASSGVCNSATGASTGNNGGTGAGGKGGIDSSACSNGGGGGGGRFGGGGGGSTSTANRGGGGGGGGSDFVTGSGTVETAGSGTTPGNSGDSNRGTSGNGGTGATTFGSASAGSAGGVVISYSSPGSQATTTVSWAHINSEINPSTGLPYGTIESPNPGAGVCTGWCNNSAYNLPSARRGLSLVAYNGYLYAIGGSDSSGVPQSTVYIAKIGANGEPQLWHPSGGTPVYWYTDTALSNARSYFSAVAYNNHMYLLGGLTTSTTVLSSNTVQMADINPMGTLTTWTTTGTTALTSARWGNTAHIYNDTLYILGGDATYNGAPITTVEYVKIKSDGTMNSWVTTTSISTSGRTTMGGSYSTVWGAYIYIVGGCTALNASGYCTTIASDVQLASINADGSLSEFNTILGITNNRVGHTAIAWQGGLYRLGGCTVLDTSNGYCTTASLDVDYGVINAEGEASTVATSVASGVAPCSGTAPYGCDSPSSGIGNLLTSTAIMNGYLYIMGGCTINNCTTYSNGVVYTSIASDGSLQKPASCPGGSYTDSYCVSPNNLPSARGAAAPAIFNGQLYLVGGFPSIDAIARTTVASDGSISAWTSQTMTGTTGVLLGLTSVSYSYAYARANPSLASTYPGNLYIFGGCTSPTSVTCGGQTQNVYKCYITTTGSIEVYPTTAFRCDTANQLQIGTVNSVGSTTLALIPGTGTGLGTHSGTVYANYIYLMGGLGGGLQDITTMRYAKFDDSNNVVHPDTGSSTGSFKEDKNHVMIIGRRRGAAFGYNGFIYVLGGYDVTSGVLADIEFTRINVSDGSWGDFRASSVSIDHRWGLSVPVSNSYAYVVGGCTVGAAPSNCTTRTNTVQTFQIYNNDSGAIKSVTALTDDAFDADTDRWGSSATVLNGYLYVAGGCISATDCTSATADVEKAPISASDGTIGSWTQTSISDLPAVRAWGKLVSVGGYLYYIGGQDSTSTNEQSTVYYAQPDGSGNISSWSTASGALGDVSTAGVQTAPRTKFGVAVWDSRIYVVSGLDGSAAVTNTVYYSPKLSSGGNIAADSWTLGGNTPDVARYGAAVTAYANNIYQIGGNNGTQYLNDTQFASIGYKTGTISQTGTAVTGSSTVFNSSMVGSTIQYSDGSTAMITAFTDSTHITVSASKTVALGTTYTILDGSVGAWTFSSSLTGYIAGAEAFAANGYMYLVGGRSATTSCSPNTLIAPISANTVIGQSTYSAGTITQSGTTVTGVGTSWTSAYDGGKITYANEYSTGTISQTGTAMTGLGTAWTTDMAGSVITYADDSQDIVVSVNSATSITMTNSKAVGGGGTYRLTRQATITAVTSATTMTVSVSKTISTGEAYRIRSSSSGLKQMYIGGTITQSGTTVTGTTSPTTADWNASYIGGVLTYNDGTTTMITAVPTVNTMTVSTSRTIATAERYTIQTGQPPNSPTGVGEWYETNARFPGGRYGAAVAYSGGKIYMMGGGCTKPQAGSYSTGTITQSGTTVTGAGGASFTDDLIGATLTSGVVSETVVSVNSSTSLTVSASNTIAGGSAYTISAPRHDYMVLKSQPQVAKYSRMIDTDSDVFPTSWLMNGVDNSVGAHWQTSYYSMHDIDSLVNPNEDCGTSSTMAAMTTWGQVTNVGDTNLGDVNSYTPKNGSGGNINCARYYYFSVSIDASQTFGYPEDVNRGPTISDLSLFFTSDPSKRLRHGKTFTGGEQQPLDTPCRQTVDPQCPLP